LLRHVSDILGPYDLKPKPIKAKSLGIRPDIEISPISGNRPIGVHATAASENPEGSKVTVNVDAFPPFIFYAAAFLGVTKQLEPMTIDGYNVTWSEKKGSGTNGINLSILEL